MKNTCIYFYVGLSLALLQPNLCQAEEDLLTISIEPKINHTVDLVLDDGSRLLGGTVSGQQDGCAAGPRAFIRREDSVGQILWERYGGGPSAGTCSDQTGIELFADFASLDADFVTTSDIIDLEVDELLGEVTLHGNNRLAWEVDEEIHSSSGFFLAVLNLADGALLRDNYYNNNMPQGPPLSEVDCQKVCEDTEVPGDHCEGTSLAVDNQGRYLVTGACKSPGVSLSDYFVARFPQDLNTLDWLTKSTIEDHDEGFDLVTKGNHVYVTGRISSSNDGEGLADGDIFLAKYRTATGTLVQQQIVAGPLEDRGENVHINSDGNVVVDAVITEEVVFGGNPIGNPEDCQQQGELIFDTRLRPLSAQVFGLPMQGFGAVPDGWSETSTTQNTITKNTIGQPGQIPNDPRDDPQEVDNDERPSLTPVSWTLRRNGSNIENEVCGIGELLHSDNQYLDLTGWNHTLSGAEPEEISLIQMIVNYALPAEPLQALERIAVELKHEYCYQANLYLKSLAVNQWYLVGTKDVCADDEVRLVAEIEPGYSLLMGFDGETTYGAETYLQLGIELIYAPKEDLCDGNNNDSLECPADNGRDASVDEIDVDADY